MSENQHRWRDAAIKYFLILAVGFGLGYYFRGNQQEITKTTLERTKRAGQRLKKSAEEGLKGAAKEIVGNSEDESTAVETPPALEILE